MFGNRQVVKRALGIVASIMIVAPAVAIAQNVFPSTGSVGIGTTNPGYPLQVVGSSSVGGDLVVGVAGSNFGTEFLPNVVGNSIFWIDDYNNMLRFSNGLTPGAYPMVLTNGGYLGIGTTAPGSQFDVSFATALSNVTTNELEVHTPFGANPDTQTNAGGKWGISFIGYSDNTFGQTKRASIYAVSEDTAAGYNRQDGLAFYTSAFDSSQTERMRIDHAGDVGIGTTSPGSKLEVNGNLKLTSGSGASMTYADGTTQTTAWTGVLCGGDYAEAVKVSGAKKLYEPGDVLVLSSSANGNVEKSQQPYSTMVAGIYATKPGVIGRRQSLKQDGQDLPMAMVGIVPTKVTAENGPIRQGDLLVTSSIPGYAMKGTDRGQMLGAVIGKAMGSLDSGNGAIEVLVTLQ